MASPFLTQLQPFEENQSPSPIEELDNPYELALQSSRSRSPTKKGLSGSPSPAATINTLQRQLSSDPDNPPPAWQRRPSFTTSKSGVPSRSVSSSGKVRRSPSESSPISNTVSPSRRVPNLTMTATRNASGPGQMLVHGSPTSAISIDDPTLALPQPAFRRRHGGSNRSSISSNHDLSSLTSEELWSMDQEVMADMSNPLTRAAERPLDTVRRMSSRIEHSPYRNGLPQDVIWPSAPVEDFYVKPAKSRSVTSMASLRGPTKSKILSRQNSRLASMDSPVSGYTKSPITSPVSAKEIGMISSNNSSSTSLASHVIKPNQSSTTLNSRPSSVYYSRDFLSSLAPREGGYAIAATMGSGLGAAGTFSVEERRRSGVSVDDRPRSTARAPVSRSAGMGRWSLDGGEHYGRPYGTPSNATTSTSFGKATSGSEPSPPADDDSAKASYLPAGAASPAGTRPSESLSPPPVLQSTAPSNPSPLGREASAAEHHTPLPEANLQDMTTALAGEATPTKSGGAPKAQSAAPPSVPPPPPAPVTPVTPLNTKKSKKELKAAAKDAKAAEKAAAAQGAAQRAEHARQAAAKREAEKLAAKKKKEEDKRKEKAEKERKKAERKSGLKAKLKSTSQIRLPQSYLPTPGAGNPAIQDVPPVPALVKQSVPAKSIVPVKPPTAPTPATRSDGPAAAPATPSQQRREPSATAQHAVASSSTRPSPPVGNSKPKLGMFGTIKKRWSSFTDEQKPRVVSQPTNRVAPASTPPLKEPAADIISVPPVAISSQDDAQAVPSNGTLPAPQPISDLPPRSTSHMHLTNSTGRSGSPHSVRTHGTGNPTAEGTASPLSKTLSRESRGNGSPSSLRRGPSSVRGPRPMPRSPNSPELNRIEGDSAATAFFDQQRAAHDLVLPDPITPSLSRDSAEGNSSLFSMSKGSQSTDLATPFTSDGSEVMETSKGELDTPEREDSGSTIHALPLAPVVATY